jgi:creatinine amidohydrolase
LSNFEHLRFELLLPWQLRQIIARSPIAYVPIGTYEWHCEHLPVGLDALTAHGLCLRAAEKAGGVVLPCLHYGTGGDHGLYPFTIMMPDAAQIEALLAYTIKRLQTFGFKTIMLFSGHFPDSQLDMIARLATSHSNKDSKVLSAAPKHIEGLSIPYDHAGVFETTLLYALHPHLVQMNRLPSLQEVPLTTDDWDKTRHDPKHPVYGVVGADPRGFDPQQAGKLLYDSVEWLVARVRASQT